MPRQPTGNPRGRPRGSGLGVGDEAPRLTVRLPADVYARLEAFAETYKYHRGDPPLAVCVREMVTFCLDHPDLFRQPESDNYRQPEIVPMPSEHTGETLRQPENTPRQGLQWHRVDYRQPGNAPLPAEHTGEIFRQSINRPSLASPTTRPHYRQPETRPTFDPTRFFVGELCPEQHRYQDSAGSLRYRAGDQNCVTCRRERNRRYNAAKRGRQTWQQTTPQRG